MNDEFNINNLPEISDNQLEYLKEINRHKENMAKIDAEISIKKYDLGISWGNAFKAFAPIVMAIVASDTKDVTVEKQN